MARSKKKTKDAKAKDNTSVKRKGKAKRSRPEPKSAPPPAPDRKSRIPEVRRRALKDKKKKARAKARAKTASQDITPTMPTEDLFYIDTMPEAPEPEPEAASAAPAGRGPPRPVLDAETLRKSSILEAMLADSLAPEQIATLVRERQEITAFCRHLELRTELLDSYQRGAEGDGVADDTAANRYYDGPSIARECTLCGGSGHVSRDCRHQQCYICGAIDARHDARSCPVAQVCFNCSSRGHISRDCLLPRTARRALDCEVCRGNHTTLNCPDVWRLYVEQAPPATAAVITRACANCASSAHFVDDCRLGKSRHSSLLPSAFNERALGALAREVEPAGEDKRGERYAPERSGSDRNRSERGPPASWDDVADDDWFSHRAESRRGAESRYAHDEPPRHTRDEPFRFTGRDHRGESGHGDRYAGSRGSFRDGPRSGDIYTHDRRSDRPIIPLPQRPRTQQPLHQRIQNPPPERTQQPLPSRPQGSTSTDSKRRRLVYSPPPSVSKQDNQDKRPSNPNQRYHGGYF